MESGWGGGVETGLADPLSVFVSAGSCKSLNAVLLLIQLFPRY